MPREDTAVPPIIQKFYYNLRGRSPGEAFHISQMQQMKADARPSSWATFMLMGDGK